MKEIKGIDVSKWQGEKFDFGLAKAEGFNFAILKCGGGDKGLYKDFLFETNYLKCKLEHIYVGAYFFGGAMCLADAEREAHFCIESLKGKAFEYPVFYDVEGDMLKCSKIALTEIIKRFCSILEAAGYIVGVYMSKSAFMGSVFYNELDTYQHWIASWNKTKPTIKNSSVDVWQYGGEINKLRNTHVSGVICDQDIVYRNYSELMFSGFNGFDKINKSASTIASEVIDGIWGNGNQRKHLLALAGYDYKEIQSEVNTLLKQGW